MSITEQRYVKYVKMQAMLPEGAVRQRMMADGFVAAEIDDFFVDGPPPAGTARAVPAMSPKKETTYLKMQQLLPEGAVRQKMTADGFSPGQVYAFFNKKTDTAGAPTPDCVSDERLKKYVKMQRMLPEGAIRQKMAVDGFTVAEVDGFFGNDSQSAGPNSTKSTETAVSDKHNATYAKMLQLLPEAVVRQRMAVDGTPVREIDAFFTAASSSSPAAAVVPNQRYAKYETMQKVLPEAVVRQKMVVDGFSVAEIDAFISHGPPVSTSHVPEVSFSTKTAEKYAKMLSVFPEAIVRQKMFVDGFLSDQIVTFFATLTIPGSDPRYQRYDKMLQMLPEGAVRQKMRADSFSALQIDAYFAHGPPRAGSLAARTAAAAVTEKRRATYVKMRSMLPDGAVRQKMAADGCDAAQIETFFAGGAAVGCSYRGA